jgi:hypothetical protein
MSDINGLARYAYDHGTTPLDYAEQQVELLIRVHLQVMAARMDNPAAFPGYCICEDLASLSRRILGDILDAGWTMPEPGDPP